MLSKQCIHTFESNKSWSLDIYEKEGRSILVSGGGSYNRNIQLCDLETKSIITTLIGHTDDIYAVKVFHKQRNTYLASGSFDKTIKIWNLTNHHLESTILIGHELPICSLELIRTNNKLYLASGSRDTINLWDL